MGYQFPRFASSSLRWQRFVVHTEAKTEGAEFFINVSL
jgi:hypothetical protein